MRNSTSGDFSKQSLKSIAIFWKKTNRTNRYQKAVTNVISSSSINNTKRMSGSKQNNRASKTESKMWIKFLNIKNELWISYAICMCFSLISSQLIPISVHSLFSMFIHTFSVVIVLKRFAFVRLNRVSSKIAILRRRKNCVTEVNECRRGNPRRSLVRISLFVSTNPTNTNGERNDRIESKRKRIFVLMENFSLIKQVECFWCTGSISILSFESKKTFLLYGSVAIEKFRIVCFSSVTKKITILTCVLSVNIRLCYLNASTTIIFKMPLRFETADKKLLRKWLRANYLFGSGNYT